MVDNEATHSVGAVIAHNNDDPRQYLYKFSFSDPEFRPQRKKILYILCAPLFFTLVLMWVDVSIFFGSLPASPILNRLDVYVTDLDHGFLGTHIINGINASSNAQPKGLRWNFDTEILSSAAAQAVVLDEHAWAVVQGTRPFLRTRGNCSADNNSLPKRLYKPYRCPFRWRYSLRPFVVRDDILRDC
jgi:hypothetical protein